MTFFETTDAIIIYITITAIVVVNIMSHWDIDKEETKWDKTRRLTLEVIYKLLIAVIVAYIGDKMGLPVPIICVIAVFLSGIGKDKFISYADRLISKKIDETK